MTHPTEVAVDYTMQMDNELSGHDLG